MCRFLSAIVGCLDTFLLLEWRFGIRRMLVNAQQRNGLDEKMEEDGGFVIDEGLIERNRLLVRCSILGGATERFVPPRGICEVGCRLPHSLCSLICRFEWHLYGNAIELV